MTWALGHLLMLDDPHGYDPVGGGKPARRGLPSPLGDRRGRELGLEARPRRSPAANRMAPEHPGALETSW